jgi:CRP-like cAMP-binding protein/predicted MFS family arabinose efflux permease
MAAVSEAEASVKARGMRAPFRHPDFRRLAVGLAISQTGDWLYNVALLVLVIRTTHSAAWVAAAGIVRLLPYVMLGTFGGLIADRYSRKRVMIVSDLARAGIMALLVVVSVGSGGALSAIVLAGLSTSFAVAYNPALSAGLPLLVDEDELSAANSIITTITNVCVALGPAVGGVLLVLGSPATAFGVNAVSFLASAAAVSRVRTDLGPKPTEAHEREPGMRERLREGIDAIRGSTDVVVLVATWTANAFLYGTEIVLFALLATGRLGIGEDGMSFLYAALGVGGIAAATIAHRAADRPRQGAVLGVATLLIAAAFAGYAFTTSPAVGYGLAMIDGAASIVVDVLVLTSLQRMLGNEVLGRAIGAVDSIVVAGILVGSIAVPPVVDLVGVRGAVLATSAIVGVVGLLVLARARAIDRRSEQRAAELEPRVALLYGLDIFTGSSRATLEALAEELTPLHVGAGEIVIREGDEPDDLFIVGGGHLTVTISGHGRVGGMQDGDYFGEIGLLQHVPRTATVTAATDCELWRMPGETFLRLVNEGGLQSSSLVANLQQRMASTRSIRREESVT